MSTDVIVAPPDSSVRGRRRSLRVACVAVIAAALVFLVIGRGHDLVIAWRVVRTADAGWLATGLALSVAIVANLAGLHSNAQRVLGVQRRFRTTVRLTAGARFLNSITKSGGAAGVATFNSDARRTGQSVQRSTAGYVLAELATHLGFSVVLIVALPFLAADHRITQANVVVFVVFGATTVALTIGVVAAARSRRAIRRVAQLPRRLRNAVARVFRRGELPIDDDHGAADELFDAVAAIRQDRSGLLSIAVHAILAPTIGIALLWTVLHAVGLQQGLRVAIVTYTIATAFSIVGILPAGLGFTEVAMGATLVSYGVPAATSIAVVAVYRLFDLWLPLAAGGASLRRTKS